MSKSKATKRNQPLKTIQSQEDIETTIEIYSNVYRATSWISYENFVDIQCRSYVKHSGLYILAKIFGGWKPSTIFAKSSILDVWQGSE